MLRRNIGPLGPAKLASRLGMLITLFRHALNESWCNRKLLQKNSNPTSISPALLLIRPLGAMMYTNLLLIRKFLVL